jgi:2-methylcitrate dehydratase PrpD
VFSTKFEPVSITGNLGDPFDIVSPGVQTKLYASCLGTHAIIEAARSLARTHAIEPEMVDSIDCRIAPLIADMLIHLRPRTGLEAKFSAPYAVTVALLNPEISLVHFTDERVQDPKARELTGKVRVTVDAGLTGLVPPAWVTVHMKDGREYVQMGDASGDDGIRGISLDHIVEKYRGCASVILDEGRTKRSLEMILELEKLDDINKLMMAIHADKTI